MNRRDVVIIGGGLSGLSAAVRLAGTGPGVTLLEQSARLGGRCYSFTDRITGDTVDNGQHLLVGAYRNLFAYLDRIGTIKLLRRQPALRLPLYHPEKGKGEFRLPRIPAPFNILGGVATFGLLSFAERRRMLDVGFALRRWNHETESRLSAMTIAAWLDGLGQSPEARRTFWDPLAIAIMNETPGIACAAPFARVLRTVFFGSGGSSSLVIPTVGQSALYVDGAVSFLAKHGIEVKTGAIVESVMTAGDSICGIKLAGGGEIACRNIISTVPPGKLKPLIPSPFADAGCFGDLSRFGYSPIVSVNLWFDRPVMKEVFSGLIGRSLQWVFNRTAIVGGRGYCVAGVLSAASHAADVPKEEIVRHAVDDLRAVYPMSRDARLLHSLVVKEKHATVSPTCETELLRPGPVTPLRGFYLAGDWTRTGYPATIEGAVISAHAAVAAMHATGR